MGITGPGSNLDRWFEGAKEGVDEAAGAVKNAAGAAANAVAGAAGSVVSAIRGGPATPPATGAGSSAATIAASMNQFVNGVSRVFGQDRELDQLSQQLNDLKTKTFSSGTMSRADLAAIQAQTAQIRQQYAALAAKRGYPLGSLAESNPETFAIGGAGQAIDFGWLAGDDLNGGALADLGKAIAGAPGSIDQASVAKLSKQIAFDLATSPSESVAEEKVHLLRAQLSLCPDAATQRAVIGQVGAALDAENAAVGGSAAISRAQFDAAASFESTAAVHATTLPPSVAGTNKPFPNQPIPGWEAQVRAATKASLDDLHASGQLFLDKIPPGPPPKSVAIKVDLNFGADGPPTIADPAETGATVSELLERAKAGGKSISLSVGESAGGENIALGRTSLDIMKDTGHYHYALEAGLEFAAEQGSAAAKASLAKVQAAEARGVFFGSKDDKVSTPADLQAAEAAAAPYVKIVDYDAAGFKSVTPDLGTLGTAAWGGTEFRIAQPWADADYRVHIARPVSTHTLAGWTGATKGLIGLQEFGRRPTDRGMAARGQSPIDGFAGLTQAAGVASIFESRTGATDVLAKIAASGNPALTKGLDAAQAKWADLKGRGSAWAQFSAGTAALTAKLNADSAAGMSQPDVMSEMRSGTRALLDAADKTNPGFRQAFWDASQSMTKVLMAAGGTLRNFIPAEAKDEAQGRRIGILAKLPDPSDLVLMSQPKLGVGGGPDAYASVKDAGFVVAATDEPTTDAMAWQKMMPGQNLWQQNFPVHATLRYGAGPMNMDEVHDVSGSGGS